MQTNAVLSNFSSSESWSILSDIERSINAKIEAIGTPLKDWDIQINYGIKTGFNDAFIIDSVKREEILNACQNEEERQRTAEIIRPILRGRDIKRYNYEFADQYIIATFPSRQYNIDNYQALRDYLLSFGKERLEQTGKEYSIKGEKVKARKKTNNKWFETQDSISYWEDFHNHKQIATQSGKFSANNQIIFFYPIKEFPKFPFTVILSPADGLLNPPVYSHRHLGAEVIDFKPLILNSLFVAADSDVTVNHTRFVFIVLIN